MALDRTLRRAGWALIALLVASPIGFCQTYPGQYPPGQYPPGQYPPGQYPPGQYPPGQYPYPTDPTMRLPGGIPVAVPTIQLPKRGSKDEKPSGDATKITVLGVDGTLRELREKDLFLETPKHLLRFRMLAKTDFKNKAGEPVRDSLLKPGDQLQVEATKLDPETALRVVLIRAGTPAERTAGERPFDHDSAQTPVEADMRPAGTIDIASPETAAGSGSAEPAPGPGSTAPRRPDLERDEAAGSVTGSRGGMNPVDDVVADARRAAEAFMEELPNFMVQQLTTRYHSFSNGTQWHADGTVSADVTCVNDQEEYHNILIDGRPSPKPVEKTGAWSTGEFVTTLRNLLSPETDAAFVRRGDDRIVGRDAYRYDFTVRKENSHWVLVNPSGRSEAPGYTGTVWIDKERHRVLRLEMRTSSFPSGFTYDKAESTLDYDFVRIGKENYLLPVKSANLACMSGTGTCMKNEIDFRNYRKYAAESDITFGK